MSQDALRPQGAIPDSYYLFGLLNAFANRLQAIGNQVFEELSWKQWLMLLGLTLYESPPGVSELAQAVGSSHQNAKQILLRLEKAGFVQLVKDPQDMRRTLVRQTDKVQALDLRYQEGSQRFMRQIYAGIPEEDIAVTLRTLLSLEKNLIALQKPGKEEEA